MPDLTVQQAIESRRSIRRYTDEQIPRETIEDLLRLANLAPTPWNLQPTKAYVATGQEMKDKLKEAAYGQPQVGAAAAVFVLTTDMKAALDQVAKTRHPGMTPEQQEAESKSILSTFEGFGESDLHWWGRAQGYTFMAFLLLAAQSKGYSTSAMLGFDPAKVRELLGLADHVEIPALVAMGVADQEGFPHHRLAVEEFTTFV